MKLIFSIGLFLLVAGCSGTGSVKIAEQGIEKFHAEFNAGHYAQLYDASAQDMKAATKREEFISFLAGAHKKLGPFKSGKQVGWNDNYATGGHFVTIQYESQFARGAAQEQFVFRVSDDKPILAGYHVNSNLFVTS